MKLNQKELKRIRHYLYNCGSGVCWVSGPERCGKTVLVEEALREFPWQILSLSRAVAQCRSRILTGKWMGMEEADKCIVIVRDPLLDGRAKTPRVRKSVERQIAEAATMFRVIVESEAHPDCIGIELEIALEEEQQMAAENAPASNRQGAESAKAEGRAGE